MVKLGNIFYFLWIAFAAGLIVGLYFIFRKRSEKTKKIVVFSMLALNLVIHFIRPFILKDDSPYISNIWFVNICAVSVLTYPFIFLSKNNTAKDFMFYLGVISGFLATVYPTEALDKAFAPDIVRFYIAHIIIIAGPLLMMLFKLHKLDYRRIWKMPLCAMAVMIFIISNQMIQSEIGVKALRSVDFFNISYSNPSLIWGPTDELAVIFSVFTPKFLKTVPVGEYAGQEKYWPLLWMFPGVVVYFITLPFLLSMIWEHKRFASDMKAVWIYTKDFFVKLFRIKKLPPPTNN